MDKKRPKNLNLITIRLPLPALVSVLHRLSGLILFLMLPGMLFALHLSLESPRGFRIVLGFAGHPLTKLALIAVCWAFLHHLFAGVRHLLSDNLGLELRQAVLVNRLVLSSSLFLTLLAGAGLWLA